MRPLGPKISILKNQNKDGGCCCETAEQAYFTTGFVSNLWHEKRGLTKGFFVDFPSS